MNAPDRIGRYLVIRRLGLGGMAEVFLVQRLGRGGFEKNLVVKRLLPHLAPDPRMVEQLNREARIGALLHHPNLIQTFDLDLDDKGTPFIVLEYVEGETLKNLAEASWAQGVSFPIELATATIAGAALGLHHLHEARDGNKDLQLVHRDISPDNLMLEDDGTVRVLDFGVARLGSATVALTEEGELKGKIPFMAPEQLRGEDVDRRCDIYALGITLYWLLTGTRPFEGGSALGGPAPEINPAVIINRALNDAIAPPSTINAEVPAALEAVVMQMLAKDQNQRLATAADAHDALLNAVAVARSATQHFVRRHRQRTGPAPAPTPSTTTLVPARMLTKAQRAVNVDIPPHSPPVAKIIPERSESEPRRSETVSNIWSTSGSLPHERARKMMVLSGAVGAALTLGIAAMAFLLSTRGDKDAMPVASPKLAVAAAEARPDEPAIDDDDLDAEPESRVGADENGADENGADENGADENGKGGRVENDRDKDGAAFARSRRGARRSGKKLSRRGRSKRRQSPAANAVARDERDPKAAERDIEPATTKVAAQTRTQTIDISLHAGRDVEWFSGKVRVGTGHRKFVVDRKQRFMRAHDKRLDGWTEVPIKDGKADLRRVRAGRLYLEGNPSISKVRIGSVTWAVGELTKLRAGSYIVTYVVGRRPGSKKISIKPDRTLRIRLR